MQVQLQPVLLRKEKTYLYSFTLAEDGGVRVKMVGPTVVGPTRDIGHQVHGPSQSQSDHNICQPDRACVFKVEVILSLL